MTDKLVETPWWEPEALARRRPNLIARNRINAAIRRYFADRGFTEVETAALQVSPGMEPHLQAIAATLHEADGQAQELYLHTSPEFACKKLLAAGEERIFTLARVWRDGERSARHHPEFTLLEWYRGPGDYRSLIEDCRGLIQAIARDLGIAAFRSGAHVCDPFAPWQILTVAEAFAHHAGFDLMATFDDPDQPDRGRFAGMAQGSGLRIDDADSWSDIFSKIMVARVEPGLPRDVPVILIDYPAPEAALARRKPDDPRLAERFELYIAGIEVANAFGELTDPAEQRRRFLADQRLKERLYGLRYPIDEELLSALGQIESAAGIALGLDRLVMLATGAARIEDVLWTPVPPQPSQ